MVTTKQLPFNGDTAVDIIAGIVFLFILAALIAVFVFYLLTLQKALARCSPENRAMQPGLVWLMLIPCFSMIWHFFVVIYLAKSLEAEFQKRDIVVGQQPGKMIGLVMCILGCIAKICAGIGIIPILGLPFLLGEWAFGLSGLVCWIIYWTTIAGYSRKLTA